MIIWSKWVWQIIRVWPNLFNQMRFWKLYYYILPETFPWLSLTFYVKSFNFPDFPWPSLTSLETDTFCPDFPDRMNPVISEFAFTIRLHNLVNMDTIVSICILRSKPENQWFWKSILKELLKFSWRTENENKILLCKSFRKILKNSEKKEPKAKFSAI